MKIPYGGREVVLPDFLVVGAMRSGSTSLYNYLKRHREIFLPSLKEPQFFSYFGEDIAPHPDELKPGPWTVEEYLRLFAGSGPGMIVGEASPSYLYIYKRSIENIRALYGERAKDLKIIGVLRNPAPRAWSIYMLKRQGGDWKKDFLAVAREFENTHEPHQYYNFLESGRYYRQVKAYQEAFPCCRFFLFEELAAEPERVVRECLELVGARDLSVPANVSKVYNFSGVPRNALLAPCHRFLFGRNPLKTALKNIVPASIRSGIKTALGAKVSKKAVMPEEVRQYLLPRYADDLKKLAGLFKDERQRTIIEGWAADG